MFFAVSQDADVPQYWAYAVGFSLDCGLLKRCLLALSVKPTFMVYMLFVDIQKFTRRKMHSVYRAHFVSSLFPISLSSGDTSNGTN